MHTVYRSLKEVLVRGIVAGFTSLILIFCIFHPSPALAFETGRPGICIGGGLNVPLLDFADQSYLGAALGFGFKAGLRYHLGGRIAAVGYYSYRSFDTHFLEPPLGYEGGYGEYRFHTFALGPRIYFGPEQPCSFMELEIGAYIPYFYIPGQASDTSMIPDNMAIGVGAGFGWHTDKVDIAIKYNLFKTKDTSYRPATFIHYLTFDAFVNLIPDE
jgi:hypothetical protein